MWQCPKCGERIDPEFDACWNCGTDRDGGPAADFRPEPDDPAVPDLGPDPDEPEEADAGPADERIVELCSAANSVEAAAICAALEDEDVPARIVGDVLGNAAGMLPLGQATAPRVWVRQSDLDRAREVLAARLMERDLQADDESGDDEPPEWDASAEPEPEALPSDVRFRFLSQGFFIVGLICIAAGALYAWHNAIILSEYSGTTTGRWIGDRIVGVESGKSPDANIPFPLISLEKYYFIYKPMIVYEVEGKTYQAQGYQSVVNPDSVLVHYNRDDPEKIIVGPIAPPWAILLFAVGVGAFMMFVGFKFR